MEDQRTIKVWALTLITARALRVATTLYTWNVVQDLQGRVLARETLEEGIEMLHALFITETGHYSDTVQAMIPGKGLWLYEFEEEWNENNPIFQTTECLQLLEDFLRYKLLDNERVNYGARFMLRLKDYSNKELERFQILPGGEIFRPHE